MRWLVATEKKKNSYPLKFLTSKFVNIYELRLKDNFVKKLSDYGKSWLTRGIVSLLIMNGKLDPTEMPYMKEAVVLVNDSEKKELLESAKKS